MLTFRYTCRRTNEERQGIIWDDGSIGTSAGDRYVHMRDLARSQAKGSLIRFDLGPLSSLIVTDVLDMLPPTINTAPHYPAIKDDPKTKGFNILLSPVLTLAVCNPDTGRILRTTRKGWVYWTQRQDTSSGKLKTSKKVFSSYVKWRSHILGIVGCYAQAEP